MIKLINHIGQVLFTVSQGELKNSMGQVLATLEANEVKNSIGQTIMKVDGSKAISISTNKAIGSCKDNKVLNINDQEIASIEGEGTQAEKVFAACGFFLFA